MGSGCGTIFLVFQDGVFLECGDLVSGNLTRISATIRAAIKWDKPQERYDFEVPFSSACLDVVGSVLDKGILDKVPGEDVLEGFVSLMEFLCIDTGHLGSALEEDDIHREYFDGRARKGYGYVLTTRLRSSVYWRIRDKKYYEIGSYVGWHSCKTNKEAVAAAAKELGYDEERLVPYMDGAEDYTEALANFIKDNKQNFYFCGTSRLVGHGTLDWFPLGVKIDVNEEWDHKVYPKAILTCLLKIGIDPGMLGYEIITRGIFDLCADDLGDYAEYPALQKAITSYLAMRTMFP